MIGGGRSGRAAAAAAEGDVLLVDERGGHDAPATRCSRRRLRSRSTRAASSRSTPATSLYRIRADRIVVATGALEQPLVFPGNDLVGVMLPSAVRRMVDDWALKPGTRAVVVDQDAAERHGTS